jgi:hypothetical protein
MIIDQAMRVMEAIAKEKIQLNIMLWGSNGVGKTQAFKALSKKLKWDFHLQPVPSMDRTEIAGIPFKDEYVRKNGDKVLVQKMAYPEYVVKAMDGEIVILFDEVNRGPKECVNSLLEFINERSMNGKPLSSNIVIGLTGNPPDERNSVKITDHAFNDRVIHILVDTSPEHTLKYYESLKGTEDEVHKDVMTYLYNNKSKLNKFDPRDTEIPVKRFASPRNWKERVNRIWKELNPIKEKYGIHKETILELIEGTLGEEASHFIQFLNSKEKPISLSQVLSMTPDAWEKVKFYANLNEDGSEKEDGITEMGYFHPVCSEIENPSNKKLVEDNSDKVLAFLSEIPLTFSFRVLNKIIQSNSTFWFSVLKQPLLNPETKTPVIDPITEQPKLKWSKLAMNSEKMKNLSDASLNDFIESKKKNNTV